MRLAILGDIHANLEALNAVLEDIEHYDVDKILCLGDIVGYGANPCECVDIAHQKFDYIVAGNHDLVAIEKVNIDCFNLFAKLALLWTRMQLSEKHKKILTGLTLIESFEDITLVHSNLKDPISFDYIQTIYDAKMTLEKMQTLICFLGHSHVPVVFEKRENIIDFSFPKKKRINTRHKTLINVGSVGQPRDDNPDAAYALYETETRILEIKRVKYDIKTAAQKIIRAGLPSILAERLFYGR